jgi:hypothetical protein
MSGLRQRATDEDAARAMGPVGLLKYLKLEAGLPSTLWMARFDDGVALVLPWEGADAVPRRLAREHKVSVVPYSGGPSALFTLPGAKGRWRVAAPDPNTLWIGHDAALVHLAAVRRGQLPAFGDDPMLVDAIGNQRATGPLWSVSMRAEGIGAWLPGGALSDTVTLAAATVDAAASHLTLEYNCKGEDAARALHARLDAWIADVRGPAVDTSDEGEAMRLLAGRVGTLTRLVERIGNATANNSPQGSEDHLALLQATQEAAQMAEALERLTSARRRAPLRPILERLVQAPSVSTTHLDGAQVRWSVEAPAGWILATLFAASEHGLAPAALLKPASKEAPKEAKEGSKVRPAPSTHSRRPALRPELGRGEPPAQRRP